MNGIPYMGSKRRLASAIINKIISENPNSTCFVDMFGGGGSVAYAAHDSGHFHTVHYNEINTAVVELMRKIQSGVTDEFYRWVSRDEFHALKGGDCWVAGLVQTCWSFGNNVKKGYLYSKAREPIQRERHFRIAELAPSLGWRAARLKVVSDIKSGGNDALPRVEHIERIERVDIQRLENINRVQRLEGARDIVITNQSYEDVVIDPSTTVVYCDIPYQGTEGYVCGGFDHDAFFAWARAQPYRVYVSSYHVPGMECVAEMNHRNTLSSTNNSKRVVERLFRNH